MNISKQFENRVIIVTYDLQKILVFKIKVETKRSPFPHCRQQNLAPSIRSHQFLSWSQEGTLLVFPDFQSMRVSEDVCRHLSLSAKSDFDHPDSEAVRHDRETQSTYI